MLDLAGELLLNYSVCCFRHSIHGFYLIDSYHALTTRLNHRVQTKVSALKDFSKNPYTCINICQHTAIDSFRNGFICSCFGYRLGIFLPTARSFHIPYRSSNYWTNIVDHLFSGGTHGLWNHVINMKCKQFNYSTDHNYSNTFHFVSYQQINTSGGCKSVWSRVHLNLVLLFWIYILHSLYIQYPCLIVPPYKYSRTSTRPVFSEDDQV